MGCSTDQKKKMSENVTEIPKLSSFFFNQNLIFYCAFLFISVSTVQ
jgi:hypothetical protein